MPNGRRADPHVHLTRAMAAQQIDDRTARRSAHDRIVDHDDALAAEHVWHGVVLQRDAVLAQLIRRLDERAPDVPVLYETFVEWQPAAPRVPDRRGDRTVG